MSAVPKPLVTYAEYLAAEQVSDVKHEYLRGEVWAMAGGTIEHGRLASRFTIVLATALAGRPCNIFSSDVRVRIVETDRTTYPDLSVVCGKHASAADDPNALVNPVVIVEVLSKDTEADDRGEKFAHYRRLESLREYVLVNQHTRRIEVFRREGDHWSFYEFGAGAFVPLSSLDCRLSVDEIYEDPTD